MLVIIYFSEYTCKVLKLPEAFRATSCLQTSSKEGCGVLFHTDNQLRCKFVACDEPHPSVCITSKYSTKILDLVFKRLINTVQIPSTELHCPDPPHINNGDVRILPTETQDHLVAFYKCTSGYASGNQKMWCNGTGRWLGIKPLCVPGRLSINSIIVICK